MIVMFLVVISYSFFMGAVLYKCFDTDYACRSLSYLVLSALTALLSAAVVFSGLQALEAKGQNADIRQQDLL